LPTNGHRKGDKSPTTNDPDTVLNRGFFKDINDNKKCAMSIILSPETLQQAEQETLVMTRNEKPVIQEAAVLVPIYQGEDSELRIILIRRSKGGLHGGQIAFPGGKREQRDRSLLETALREANEEIGIATESVEILEALPVVHTQTTGFRVSPFLARIIPPPQWCREEREVAEVLEVRVRDLAAPQADVEQFSTSSEPQHISFYQVGQDRVWGLTYRILKPIVPRLLARSPRFILDVRSPKFI
jgi:8-oxo-dGTP pyrophosphatase MutT (NUDIX family)